MALWLSKYDICVKNLDKSPVESFDFLMLVLFLRCFDSDGSEVSVLMNLDQSQKKG